MINIISIILFVSSVIVLTTAIVDLIDVFKRLKARRDKRKRGCFNCKYYGRSLKESPCCICHHPVVRGDYWEPIEEEKP